MKALSQRHPKFEQRKILNFMINSVWDYLHNTKDVKEHHSNE